MSTAPDPAVAASRAPLPARLRDNWRVTYPIIVGSLTTLLLSVADTAILGRYSTQALATVGLVLPIYILASALIVPLGTAVQVLVARWEGAEDRERVERMLTVGLVFCTALGLAVSAALLLLAPRVVSLVASGDPLPGSTTVLRILALCLPFTAVTVHYRGMFGGMGETRIAMRVALLVNVTNVPLDYALVFGLDLGAVGSALGTLGATALGALYIVLFGRRRLGARLRLWQPAHLRTWRPITAPLWRIGWPDSAFGLVTYGADVLLIGMVATLGATALAASRLMVITISILFAVVFGVSSGISILVGQRIGARDLDGADGYRRSGAVLMAGLATVLAVPLLLAPTAFFGLFTPDAATVAEARSAVYLLAGIAPLMVAGLTMAGVLRAGGDTRSLLVAGVVSHFVLSVPVAYLCTQVLDFGFPGIYVGFLAGWAGRTAVTWLRYRRRAWADLDPALAPTPA